MSQNDLVIANQSFPSFRTDLNSALQAINTSQSGTSRPSGAVSGTIWLDTTGTPTSNTLKFFDGTDDISLASINYTSNTVDWLDSSITITGLSTSATGTVLTLSDSATTSTVNLIIDNDKEIRFREATANGTNYVSLSAPASLSADLTFTLPATDGTSGQVLQTNGSGVLSFATVGGLAWQTIITGATLSAVASRGYWIDTTSNACTVTLPASATNGDTIILADYARKWGTNAVTINQNSLNFQGFSSPNPVYNTNGQSVTLVYSGATKGWIPTVDDDVTLETPQTYSIDFLVIGGGASGGTQAGGGGGAGGYRTSTQTGISAGISITVTVGDGGAAVTSEDANGNSGSSSSISGSGLTTITSAGGGTGGGYPNNGVSGGSGGGGGGSNGTTGGSGNTPSTSPSQGNNGGTGNFTGNRVGGGGGGSGAVGSNASTDVSGAGGAGTASSITGSSVTRAGGGGGSTNSADAVGAAGGSGGGGAGGNSSTAAVAGTVNTGSGGGGGGGLPPKTSGAGGKGVVILSIPTASYSGTITGSPTESTSGSNKILIFTGSGSYTT